MIPNFLGVGAQRCATTWLFECLREHPDVFLPEIKEINYFSDINSNNYERGLEWYRSFFNPARNERVIGEITPEYLIDENAPIRIKKDLGNVKLIILIRNPILRIYSSYGRGLREGDWKCNFSEFVKKNTDLCLDRGLYYKQISRYYNYFNKDSIIIKVYEDISKNPLQFIQDIYQFLGVDSNFIPTQVNNQFNKSISNREGIINTIVNARNLFYNVDYFRKLIKYIERQPIVNRRLSKLITSEKKIDADIYKYLIKYYSDDCKKLSDLINRNLLFEWFNIG